MLKIFVNDPNSFLQPIDFLSCWWHIRSGTWKIREPSFKNEKDKNVFGREVHSLRSGVVGIGLIPSQLFEKCIPLIITLYTSATRDGLLVLKVCCMIYINQHVAFILKIIFKQKRTALSSANLNDTFTFNRNTNPTENIHMFMFWKYDMLCSYKHSYHQYLIDQTLILV